MKVLVDIPESKLSSLMEILNGMPSVKVKMLTDSQGEILKHTRDAVVEMKKIRSGKKIARNAEDFLNEL